MDLWKDIFPKTETIDQVSKEVSESFLLKCQQISKTYAIRSGFFGKKRKVHALSNLSFFIQKGKTFALVGESGSGKTTLAKVLLQLEQPTWGQFCIFGKKPRAFSGKIQMIFQDPVGSLNPRLRVWKSVSEPLWVQKHLSKKKSLSIVLSVLKQVGLSEAQAFRFPHQLSGGQCQRIGIARALLLHPKLLICDEPVSALDVSVQAQVLNLLEALKIKMGLSYLFISHDLSVVKHVADEICILYLGEIMEWGTKEVIFSNPLHPYTQGLLISTPSVKRRLLGKKKTHFQGLEGEIPSVFQKINGCVFYSRCRVRKKKCLEKKPILRFFKGRWVRCHLYS